MNNQVLSALSLSKKAGKLVMGMDVVKAAVLDGSAQVVALAQDLAPRSRQEIERLTQEQGVPTANLPHTMDEIWMSVNKRAGILAINDEGLARLLRRKLEQLPVQNPEQLPLDDKEDSNL